MKTVQDHPIAAALLLPAPHLQAPAAWACTAGRAHVQILNLDANRAAQVTAIMTDAQNQRRTVFESMKGKRGDPAAREAAHAQMKAIGDGTKAKLAQVLTPDEMAKTEGRKVMRGHGHGPMRG